MYELFLYVYTYFPIVSKPIQCVLSKYGPCFLGGGVSIHVVQPVDEVEESERDGENHARPLVNGAYIRQVGDLELELGRAPPQTAVGAAAHGTALQRVVAEAVSRGSDGLAKLHARAVERHDGVARVAHAAAHVRRHHLVVHLQSGEKDVAISIHLDEKKKKPVSGVIQVSSVLNTSHANAMIM